VTRLGPPVAAAAVAGRVLRVDVVVEGLETRRVSSPSLRVGRRSSFGDWRRVLTRLGPFFVYIRT